MATEMPIPQDYNRFIPGQGAASAEDDEPSLQELFDVEPEAAEIEELPDGSAIVKLEDELNGPAEQPDFYENLAEKLDSFTLGSIASRYLTLLEKDKEARSKRDEQYEEGLRRSGLGNDAPGGAQFQGASRVVHPVLAESSVDFAARAIKELFPSDGPVRTNILGEADETKQEVADRKKEFMNWQFTQQIEEYRDEAEQMLTQLPFGGSQYMKMWYDEEQRRPRAEFVPIDNIYLPFAAGNFYTAGRVTEVDDITQDTFEARVASGMYRDMSVYKAPQEPDMSKARKANLKIEGATDDGTNPDGVRRVFNVYTWLKVDDDSFSRGARAPYILMLDDLTNEVLGLYRNWEAGDERMQKLDWLIEFKFIPWRGAYAIGFPHLIGGLSAALTGALRALLDSAHINNAATMLKLKGAKISGQSQNVEVTQVAEIEGAPGVDDIRKIAMPMPFNAPSPVLFQLLGWLTDAAKGVVTTSEEKIADISNNAPVGTTQALIEQGAVVFSAIHARLHNSQMRVMKVLSRLNRWYLREMDCGAVLKDMPVTPEDFARDDDVVPVSDPNIFSDTQRFAQVQAIAARAQLNPDLYNRLAVEKRLLKILKVPNVGELLPDPTDIEDMNPALENVAMSLGKPVGAFPSQDHLAHIQTHLDYGTDPVYGSNPAIAPVFQPACIEHVKQHMLLWYLGQVGRYAQTDAYKVSKLPPQMQQVFAVAGQHVKLDSMQTFQGVMQTLVPMMQMAQQAAQQRAQQPLQDPQAQALFNASMAETQRKAQHDQAEANLKQAALQQSGAEHAAELQAKMAIAAEDNRTKQQLKLAELGAEAARTQQEHLRTAVEAQHFTPPTPGTT